MLKLVLTGAVAAGALLAISASARAADTYTFALVPKNTNNPFFDQALAGCKKAEAELKGAVKCLYIGPGEHGGGDEEAQIVADLVTKKVDGIAVSPANAPAMANALQGAGPAKIPVLTWDSDLLPKGKALRAAYVGTHNYKDKMASGPLALVVADTLPIQIDLMKRGLSSGQVGQRPFEMGYKAMYFLKDMKDGKPAPADPTYTGLDVCTPKTADTCVGGGS